MIFSPDLAAKIKAGQKTVTRRPVKRHSAGHILPCTYKPRNRYAVQLARGGFEVDRIRIISVTRETIEKPLSWTEAGLEGFESPAAFEERWESLHGKDASRDVWRIEFELAVL